jgi:hypothetical protein
LDDLDRRFLRCRVRLRTPPINEGTRGADDAVVVDWATGSEEEEEEDEDENKFPIFSPMSNSFVNADLTDSTPLLMV